MNFHFTLFCCAIVCLSVAPSQFNPAKGDEKHERRYRDELKPLLDTYCADCHTSDSAEAGFDLKRYGSAKELLKNRKDWVRALRRVEGGIMPPEDGPKMDDGTRARVAKLIDDLANAADCIANPNPGKVILRRLTRYEYRNTVRDLCGVDYKPAAAFPADDVGYGFDNIGDVLTLPPLLLEKYFKAAEEISLQAIVTPPPGEVFERTWLPRDMKADGGSAQGSRWVLASTATISVEESLPFSGEFTLTVSASGDQAGDEPCKVAVLQGDKQVGVIDVPAKDSTDYPIKLNLAKGPRTIGLKFLNDYYSAAKDGKKAEDRNLYVHLVKIEGSRRDKQTIPEFKMPESHRKIIFLRPDDKTDVEAATRAVLQRFSSRAFRRPATDDELKRLCKLAAEVRDGGGLYEEGIQVAMQAVMVSPYFIYKVETPKGKSGFEDLNDFELAVRLSYFLWGSMPDDPLLLDAWKGRLRDPQVLREHALRMMKDNRSSALIENFVTQWLQLRLLERINPDPKLFPQFNNSIRDLLKRETLRFVNGIMRENLPITALLDGQFTFLNEDLAKFYGIPDIKGPEFRAVSLKGTPRGGLLTQGSVLLVTSNPTRTSPVKRGKWVLDNLLGMPPPPAPPNVPELEKGKLSGTLREQMEQHRANAACASCHKLMDPLGFAMENFDAIGRWRDVDKGTAIDASGELPDGVLFNGVVELRTILAKQRLDQFVRCLTEKMLTYALGRGLEYYDQCAADSIITKVEQEKLRFSSLIVQIILSEPFRKQGVRE